MLRRSCFAQMRTTAVLANFFPLGRSRGPKNDQSRTKFNSLTSPVAHHQPITKEGGEGKEKPLKRGELQIKCPQCRFEWRQSTLIVFCPRHKNHIQRETWFHPTWMWGKQQPLNYDTRIRMEVNERTGMIMAKENAKSMNNERRAQGLTSYNTRVARDRRGIARRVAGIGGFSNRWSTHFPYPT